MRILALVSLFVSLTVSASIDRERFEKDMKEQGYSIQECLLISTGIDHHADSLVMTNLRNTTSLLYPKKSGQKIMILEGGKYHTLNIAPDIAFIKLFEALIKCSK
ncbi:MULTISPECIES: hypothetical protein [Vibrio]|uniref:hypothetical protein n=1 Tax=Vibrio TaxID=662 RepID=UPI001BD5AD80|nr:MULTISPECIES: hypothetical protein [Vibrio]MBS9962816.1 hypothetical protein [Vibrio alginolyticus]MDW1643058.1 hypothetical protein [Vibrio sp. Vb2976]MDW2276545.1 hypothetical protein [Vibrio sp. 1074]MDW2287708.1 hypothetical protein [Vibrio sp. 1562]